MNALKLRGTREGGLSLIAMLVIVILVGGISAAFFLLSMTEGQSADIARNRTKSYYLGEAAVEQVASMLKVAAANYNLPNNPVSVSGSPLSGTLTASGITSNWAFRHYDTTTAAWYPTWNSTSGTWNTTSPSRMTTSSDVSAAGTDTSQIQLYLTGSISILMEVSSVVPGVNAKNSETFTYAVNNFQNISGTGVGNTGDKNYFTIAVEGRATHYDRGGSTGTTRGTQVKVTREMELNNQSLLPFFAFFSNDLEFLPGPAFVGNGKVHTNGDLYLGGGTSIDLNTDYIGAVGQVYRHRKNNGSYTDNGGPVTLHQPIVGTPAIGQKGSGSTPWASTLESATVSGTTTTPSLTWSSDSTAAGLYPTVMNGATGAQAMATPPVGSIQPPATSGGTGGTFYEWAKNPATSAGGVSSGLIISIDTSGVATAKYNSGSGQVDVTSALTSSGAITSGQIADNRQSQSAYVRTTNVDIEKLRATGYFPSGGILYTTDARNGTPVMDPVTGLGPPSPPPTVPSGFVFKNGANLAGSVNLVSNGPVYVQGDFNTANGTTINPSTGAPYTWQPASVIADAVNLLSNGWTGTKTPGGGISNATETTYNFALITGNVPTIAGTQYSGGLENLPRFHENWGGVNCNYRGSLINLWQSAIATGVWGQNNVYSPPNRNWDWDSKFGASTVKIPGFPKAVTINRTIFMMDFWGAGGTAAYRSVQ